MRKEWFAPADPNVPHHKGGVPSNCQRNMNKHVYRNAAADGVRLHKQYRWRYMANACHHERDLLVRILVNYQLLTPYGEHWVYDTPLFGLCLEATRNTDNSQWGGAHTGSRRGQWPPPALERDHSTRGSDWAIGAMQGTR